MQTNLGGSLNSAGTVAAYSYAARYVYSDMVAQNDNFLRLTAAANAGQAPISSAVLTRPASRPARFQDVYGNVTHRARVNTPHQELTILSIGVVQLEPTKEYPAEVSLPLYPWDASLEQFLTPTPLVNPESLAAQARDIVGPAPGLLEAVELIIGWVRHNIQYLKSSTTVATTAVETLETRIGVCQDMAHLAVGMLRSLGIPSRYVCGLLATEVGETHAWLEYWHPQLGWLPADPTRGQAIPRYGDLIKFAVGRDYTEAAPVVGTFVSRGSGWLELALAQVKFDTESVTFDDALGLIEGPDPRAA